MQLSIGGTVKFHMMNYEMKDSAKISEYIKYSTGSTILLPDKCVPDALILEKLKDLGATHVLVGINYGARVHLKYEQEAKDMIDELTVGGSL